MSIEQTWGNFFKPEVKSSGRKLVAQEKVSISSGSDTGIQAYVRATPPMKVVFSSEGVAARSFEASCSCPAAKKGQFCKHVWAVLLCVEEKYPDFIASKQDIEKAGTSSSDAGPAESSYQETAKVRAAEYRKEQYQKQKLRAKELKRGATASAHAPSFPAELEESLAYFSKNGFPMPSGPDEAILAEAKKKLSRVFHPDRGGSHEESVELNRHCELLWSYLRS